MQETNNQWKYMDISSYGGKRFINASAACELLSDGIQEGKPLFVGRFGETESRTCYCQKRMLILPNQYRHATWDLCNNAGFFPRRIGAISKFVKEYLGAVGTVDYMAIFRWKDEEKLIAKYENEMKGVFLSKILDPLLLDRSWTCALEGKRVLVVSPFSETIEAQYKKREKLFANSEQCILPKFDLRTYKAVQSIGGQGADGFSSWFEALDYMKNAISRIDYDIALLGCGAYGMPLGSFIKAQGKQAIYMGGCLQLLFGILGRRWENQEYVMRHVNDAWTRPSKGETPQRASSVESGCYW